MPKKAIVIGAGIVGLATARALAVRGDAVTVIERNEKAIGASIRNFGMIWPIGQPDGELFERAMLSKSIWKQLCDSAKIWYEEAGSLHVAYTQEEWQVLQELQVAYRHRGYSLLNAIETSEKSPCIVTNGLLGSLYSPHEMIINPRLAIPQVAQWLNDKYNVQFIWGKTITDIAFPQVYGAGEAWEADEIFICSGADFETLYPAIFSAEHITKCKLQMMKLGVQPDRIGPALCGGLSLLHYSSFKVAPSLGAYKDKIESLTPDFLKWGIHVMVSQNDAGELIVGDSHEYGLPLDSFDKSFINKMILDYLKKFAHFKNETVIETWNGIYPKLTDGKAALVLQPEPGVTIINGLGGAGMTLAFGLCGQLIGQKETVLGAGAL